MKRKIAIFSSGSGTNAENIISYFSDRITAQVVLIVSNRAEAPVGERARRLNKPFQIVSKADLADPDLVLNLLRSYEVDLIVLAGFLLRIPAYLIEAYPRAIINIHPALLPRFGGAGMYGDRVHEAVKASGAETTGITVHYVNEEYDEGNILFQAACSVEAADTPQGIAAKVHELEYRYYPEVIERLITGLL